MSIPNSKKRIAGFLRLALEELKAAKALQAVGNRYAIYHCAQAAEKVIRAVLISEGRHAGREHRLDIMVDQIPDENPMKLELRKVDRLSSYLTSYRYPTDVGRIIASPEESELCQFLTDVRSVLDEVASRFSFDLDGENEVAGCSDPIR